MVKLIFYGESQDLDQIPEGYKDFIQIIGVLFNIEGVEQLFFEFTKDNKNYDILNQDTYNSLFLNGNQYTTVFIYFSYEETNYYKNKKEDMKIEEKEEEEQNEEIEKEDDDDEINTEKNNVKENNTNEIKLPEITKEMVLDSIIKQVKENMKKSKINQKMKEESEEKAKKQLINEEKEKQKDVSDQMDNIITNRLNNLKEELINDSKIKLSQVMSESQINLNNFSEGNNISIDHKKNINSKEKHPDIICSKCKMNPIEGNRYCCVFCNNINFCEKCEEENGFIHGHPLYKFKLRIEKNIN